MKEIRIFIASSKELLPERNYLSYLTLALEGEFEKRGIRVRLSKWEYVDPRMTAERTEDRYLNEMYGCDAALVLFRNIAGMYTREELDKALAAERAGTTRLKTHEILFAADAAPDSEAARLRSSLSDGSYGIWSSQDELRDRFLALIDRVEQCEKLVDVSFGENVRTITAFLAADDELSAERDAFADTVLNVNDLLELAHRGLRVAIRFYDPGHEEDMLDACEMGLVIYGTNCRVFGKEEIERTYARVKDARQNPKRFYVFFRDLDETAEKALDDAFRTFRDDFVTKLGHFTCQFGDANALRLSFLLSLERYAGESVKEYYSTVTAPTAPVFAGREKELLKLCELLEPVSGKFPFGRLPVITGAGGTGKSELARQFAWQRRIGYPGGVFQVDMEHVKTWDDVFLGLLKGISNNGSPVKDYLEIKNDENDSDNSAENDSDNSAPQITGAKVRDALLAKARQSGPILLVLDNVEGCMPLLGRDGGFRKAFPAGFSERVRVNVIATARVCDVMLRETDWAVPFPLADLSPEAALEVLLEDRPEADEAERKAAGRVAELLGYRALYLRRVPALIGDLYAETICDSYAELVKSLEENLLATIAEETEETHLPEILWKMTRERLLKMPLGAECVKLVEVAAFFSPEGFPRHILLHLWKTVVAPELDEKKFARAFEIVRHHNIFQSSDPVRIHRLDRAAILHSQGGEDSELLDAIGRSLANYLASSPEIWLPLAEQFPRVFQWIPDSIIGGKVQVNGSLDRINFQAALLIENPAFADFCSWEKLDGRDWVRLLLRQPQFAEKCPWEKLDGKDWGRLLQRQPQFVERCPWGTLDGEDWAWLLRWNPQFVGRCPREKLNGKGWAWLLGRQPQFAERCPWEKLDGEDWAWLLRWNPQFAERCPWEKLDGRDWEILLEYQPQFAERCPWEKLSGKDWAWLLGGQPQFVEICPWGTLNGEDWAWLLRWNPQFVGRCPREKLSGKGWAWLLGGQPQFADRCPWDTLDGRDWEILLEYQPQFANKCPMEKLDGKDWGRLLQRQPQFVEICPWGTLDGEDWAWLLRWNPQFGDRCPWDTLSGKDWAWLLGGQPQFAERCPWDTLEGGDWANLLKKQPQFADKCPGDTLSGRDWEILLEYQPQFANRCPMEKLDGKDWGRLLQRQPQFVEICPWGTLDSEDWAWLLRLNPQFADQCPWDTLSGRDWAWLLREQPQFADKCPWDTLSGREWEILLEYQPQFADRCPWEKLSGSDWAGLLRWNPQFADRCPGDTLSGRDWEILLEYQPQFADRCPWEKLDGRDWGRLLLRQPQFADRCPWEKLSGRDWAWLLRLNPQFADRCPWEKLDGRDWGRLLLRQPQFADKCPWEKLDGSDWAWLLGEQPQFADKCVWHKLSEDDWARLLEKQPQLADRHPDKN